MSADVSLAVTDKCLSVWFFFVQDLRSNNNMSPLDSSGSTAESYTSDTTLSAGSPTHQFPGSQELNDSGKYPHMSQILPYWSQY